MATAAPPVPAAIAPSPAAPTAVLVRRGTVVAPDGALPTHSRRRTRYWPGLDGMRAIAIVAVVTYHLEPTWLPGGFFGVDVFFVISGYLITSMLAAEWSDRRGIDVRRFWARRIRRLYPAVVALVGIVVVAAAVVAPSALVPARTTIPATLLYLTNWWFVLHHVPYFEAIGRPPLFVHFWSLAIEEQYYLVWPPILLVALSRGSRPARIATAALVGAVGSSVAMALLWHVGADTNRLYYGSDTHAQGLLLGSALGLLVPPGRLSARVTRPARRWLDGAGIAALVTIGLLMLLVGQSSAFTWRGGIVAVVCLTGVAAVVAAHPASRLSGLLAAAPMRWLGTRSYSIYLWHWPILDLTRPGLDVGLRGAPLAVVRLLLIAAAAEGSYRLVERPWRTGQAQAKVRALLSGARRYRHLATAGAGAAIALVVVLLVGATAPATPPELRISATAAARAPIQAAPTAARAPAPSGGGEAAAPVARPPIAGPPSATRPAVTRPAGAVPAATRPAVTAPAATAAPVLLRGAPGGPVLALGDSVMLAASADLTTAFGPAVTVDASVGRQVAQGIDRLRRYRAAGRLDHLRALVVGLGSNGPFLADQMRQLLALAGGVHLVLVNVRVPLEWQSTTNATIAAMSGHPRVTVVDWYAASGGPRLLYPDAVHPDPAGQVVYSNLLVRAVGAAPTRS